MSDDTQLKNEQLSRDLLALYDDLSEFNAYCAFFCEAAACLIHSSDYCGDENSAEGLRIFAQQLKEKSATLKRQAEAAWTLADA
jgi:hypothetical protein